MWWSLLGWALCVPLALVALVALRVLLTLALFAVRFRTNARAFRRLNPNAVLPEHPKRFGVFETFDNVNGVDYHFGDSLLPNGDLPPILRIGMFVTGWLVLRVNSPELLKTIFTNPQLFHKTDTLIDGLKPLLGTGLVMADGLLWKQQRRLLTPMFHFEALRENFGLMVIKTKETIDRIKAANSGLPNKAMIPKIDGFQPFGHISLSVINDLAFGGAFNVDELAHHWHEVFEGMRNYFLVWFIFGGLTPWVPEPLAQKHLAGVRYLRQTAQRVINQRRAGGDLSRNDLINKLLKARGDDGQPISDEQIIDESMTFLLGGHDTASNTLAWSMFYLSKHPDVQHKVHSEVDQQLPNGRLPLPEDLGRLSYCRCIVQETLRLRPPVLYLDRVAAEDTQLGEYKIPKGTVLQCGIYTVQRNPSEWKDPMLFRPERFANETAEGDAGNGDAGVINVDGKPRHPFAYIPFSAGPRNCIGSRLAMQEATIILAMMMQHFTVETDPADKIVDLFFGTYTPHGLKIRLVPRN